jgi:hypothetical protein
MDMVEEGVELSVRDSLERREWLLVVVGTGRGVLGMSRSEVLLGVILELWIG